MKILFLSFVLLLIEIGCASAAPLSSPWTQYGMNEYETGIMTVDSYKGAACAFIKSRTDSEEIGGGRLWQAFKPSENWIGKRIKMSAYIKTIKVKGAAGMSLNIYTGSGDKLLDYMLPDRVINGTTNWTKYEIVTDVPKDSDVFSFGIWIEGTGEVRVDEFKFEIVSTDVKTTTKRIKKISKEPENLDFEDIQHQD